MPLKKGCSNKTKSANIREMVHDGHPQNRAVAAAMESCRRNRKRHGREMNFHA